MRKTVNFIFSLWLRLHRVEARQVCGKLHESFCFFFRLHRTRRGESNQYPVTPLISSIKDPFSVAEALPSPCIRRRSCKKRTGKRIHELNINKTDFGNFIRLFLDLTTQKYSIYFLKLKSENFKENVFVLHKLIQHKKDLN